VAKEDDFFSFDEALDELRLKEEELKRLVSEGEIRAFREGETMRLRRTDVESLRSELSGGEGGEVVEMGDSIDDLVFDDEPGGLAPGMATEELSEADTLLDEDVPDVGEELDLEEEPAPTRSAAARPRRPAAAAAGAEEETESGVIRLVMIATSVILVLAIPVSLGVSSGEPSSVAKSIAGVFGFELQ